MSDRRPHLGSDLALAHVTPHGLRSDFHGWCWGTDGQCVDAPGNPQLPNRRLRHYTTVERWGFLWAWLVTCRPGDLVDFSFSTTGEQFAGSGRAEFMGASYSEVFDLAQLSFAATPLPFPNVTGPGVGFQQPFTFEGTLRAFTDAQFSNLAFATTLRGS